ncbi:hypothetical protein PRIPAC_89036, partial [Pristionchus pacificus]|uniref:Xrn1 helical domain-containing protein n=1 Tax=Pristionchus pacificus TaxID=54126 RepID=A0A2A6B679_PRIPA
QGTQFHDDDMSTASDGANSGDTEAAFQSSDDDDSSPALPSSRGGPSQGVLADGGIGGAADLLAQLKDEFADQPAALQFRDMDDAEFENKVDKCWSRSINNDFKRHKKRYYNEKLKMGNISKGQLREQAEDYVRAIQWNLHYYYHGCCSWNWYFRHHYAPYISDVLDFTEMSMGFEMSTPFLPFEQLLAVLPAASSDCLPRPLRDHTVEKVIAKDHTVEKVITDVECETEGFRDHKAPAVIENVIVKVECEAGSALDHNAPEAKVKVRGHETNDSGYTEIFLQDRYSDNVRVAPENTVIGKSSRMEKKAKFKPISERDNPIQCDHLSSEIDVKMVIPSEADLMCNPESTIADFYPTDFRTDLNGKKNDWEAVVLIPFIDEKRLLDAIIEKEPTLTDEDRARNVHGPHLLFTTKEAPENGNWCSRVEIEKDTFRIPIKKVVHGLLPNVKLDVFFPGFPTMKHLPHKGELKEAHVKFAGTGGMMGPEGMMPGSAIECVGTDYRTVETKQ